MQTITAKEAKNRLGKVIDMALTERAVAISKNGRDAVVLVSADYFRELAGIDSFINDTQTKEKHKRRIGFAESVKAGLAKSSDASMFQNTQSVVTFRNEEF
jgi:prevent-host-death family protein